MNLTLMYEKIKIFYFSQNYTNTTNSIIPILKNQLNF